MSILNEIDEGVKAMMKNCPDCVPATLMKPYWLLRGLDYQSLQISEILNYISVNGTCEGCLEFRSDVDRQLTEDLLLDPPAEIWDSYDEWRYVTTNRAPLD